MLKKNKCRLKKKTNVFVRKEILCNNVYIEEDKEACIIKRAQCTEEEWKEYEDKVESEMDLRELLEDLGKELEAAKRLSMKLMKCIRNQYKERFKYLTRQLIRYRRERPLIVI